MPRRVPITERKLEERRKKLAAITAGFDYLADHVLVTDTDSNILYANKAAQEITGFTVAEMLGKNPGDLWGGLMPDETYQEMYHTLKVLKRSWHGLVRNRRKDGSEFWQWLRVNPILDENNECEYFVGIEPHIDHNGLGVPDPSAKTLVNSIVLSDYVQGHELKITELTEKIERIQAKLDKLDPKDPDKN